MEKQKLSIEKDNIPQYYQARYKNVCEALTTLEELQPRIDLLTEAANNKHKEVELPVNFPINSMVNVNKPVAYIHGKHIEDRELEDVEVVGTGVLCAVKVTEETTEYLESNSTGEFNLTITQKQKKVGSYQSVSYQQNLTNQHNVKVAEQKVKEEEEGEEGEVKETEKEET